MVEGDVLTCREEEFTSFFFYFLFFYFIYFYFLLLGRVRSRSSTPVNTPLKGRSYSMACKVTWPESPSLFLWEYLNSLVFETPVEMGIELVARIVADYDIIQNTSGIFVRVRQNLLRRCNFCIEVGGRQFEQLLLDAKWFVNCVNVLYLQVTVTNVNKK